MSVDPSGVSVSLTPLTTAAAAVPVPELPVPLLQKVADLSGSIHHGVDLVRHAPALAAVAQTLAETGAARRDLVLRAAHYAVNRFVPDEERAAAHDLVTAVLPATLSAVVDVARGRVTIGAAVQAAAVEAISSPEGQRAAVGLLTQCLACLFPPRPGAPSSQ